MAPIGFSTGSLAFGDFAKALQMMVDSESNAVELSALREEELEPLMHALPDLDLSRYQYWSFHAPSKLSKYSESQLVDRLSLVAKMHRNIILHPDVIKDFSLWRKLGSWLCIENMDKRKVIGRTLGELKWIFHQLPEASLCFDVGHARQVDPSMLEANRILTACHNRIKQFHVSEVNSRSIHESLSLQGIWAFRNLAKWLNADVPVILETPVSEGELDKEIEKARWAIGIKPIPAEIEAA